MVVRISLEKSENPFLTTRIFLKMFGCLRAIIIPEDSTGHTIIMVNSEAEYELVKKVRAVKNLGMCEVLPDNFEDMLKKFAKPIRDKKVFVSELKKE